MAAQGVAARLIRLRYAGSCRSCDALLDVGTKAEFDAATKTVRCTSCLDYAAPGAPTVQSVEPIDALEAPSTADHAAQELERGIAGHSAGASTSAGAPSGRTRSGPHIHAWGG